MPQEVGVLAVNVTADDEGCGELQQHGLREEELPRLGTQLPDLALGKVHLWGGGGGIQLSSEHSLYGRNYRLLLGGGVGKLKQRSLCFKGICTHKGMTE